MMEMFLKGSEFWIYLRKENWKKEEETIGGRSISRLIDLSVLEKIFYDKTT